MAERSCASVGRNEPDKVKQTRKIKNESPFEMSIATVFLPGSATHLALTRHSYTTASCEPGKHNIVFLIRGLWHHRAFQCLVRSQRTVSGVAGEYDQSAGAGCDYRRRWRGRRAATFLRRYSRADSSWCINSRCSEIPLISARYGANAGIAGAPQFAINPNRYTGRLV